MAYQFDQWSQEKIKQVWVKGKIVPGYDPDRYRQDIAGAWMEFGAYGDTDKELSLGWEIDHRKPVARCGTDDLSNLRPLQWRNNRSKGDDYPEWTSVVASDGDSNIIKRQGWIEH